MDALRKPLVADHVEFVFLCWTGCQLGVLLSRPYYELVVHFAQAKELANTWGELLGMVGPNAAEFVMGFTHTDGYVAEDGDSIESIRELVWVLHSDEFPLTQCAEESYTFYGSQFPPVEGAVRASTEYGEELRFYPKTSFFQLKAHLEHLGHSVAYAPSDCGDRIYAY